MSEQKIESLKKVILKIVNGDNKMEGKYQMPYSESDDDWAEYSILYKLVKTSLWEQEKYKRCKYSGSLYVQILDIIVGFDGDFESFNFISDLPGWVKDDLEDKILDSVENFLPMVCVDVTFVYTNNPI
jgi:hypothetical protein